MSSNDPLPPDAATERMERAPTPGPEPVVDEPPSLLPQRYRGRSPIGRGGMGEVVRAQDANLRRDVAIKRALNQRDAETQARFVAEAQIGGQLDHPGVLPVYDFGLDASGTPFFAMKLVEEHRTLADIITALRAGDRATENAFSFQRRVALVQQVCRTISYAHKQGVVHRDLKPANIVVGQYGEVYVVDWGIAQVGHGQSSSINVSPEVRAVLDQFDAEAIMGTPAYMSPEYLAGTASSPACDVWSICVVLYEFLTLRHPFGDDFTPQSLLKTFETLPPRAAESFRDDTYGRIPRALSLVVQRGLGEDADSRWTTAHALEMALQSWLEGASPIVCPGTLMQRVLARTVYMIDQRPVLIPMVLLAFFCFGLSLFVSWLLDLFL